MEAISSVFLFHILLDVDELSLCVIGERIQVLFALIP